MCPVTSLDLAEECWGNDSRSVYSRSADICSDGDEANENHSLPDSYMIWLCFGGHSAQYSTHPSEVVRKKKRSWHDTLWNAEFPAVPRCCCADVPRGDVQRIHYLLVSVSLITLVQILFKSPFEQQMIPATDSFGAARPFLTPLLMPYD